MSAMDRSGGNHEVRVTVTPGSGRIARRDHRLLFVPAPTVQERPAEVDDLFARFARVGPAAAAHTDVPRCVVDWSDASGHVVFHSSVDLWVGALDAGTGPTTLAEWIATRSSPSRPGPSDTTFVVSCDPSLDARSVATDLRDGDVYAGTFGVVFAAEPPTMSWVASITIPTPLPGAVDDSSVATTAPPDPISAPGHGHGHGHGQADVDEPQFDELTDLDVTLAPIGPITYPDDDTDRTFRRPGDVRCPRGHANANTNLVCRVCGDPLDSTASRPGPRASTAAAGLRLPDGTVIPINRTIVIGRSPRAESARLTGAPRLVALDAPESVSRTHVVVEVDEDGVTVTDCDARGRTAVIRSGDSTPIALVPWQPRRVCVGDIIKLGGPTTLAIADPAELRLSAAFEPTAIPPERDEPT